MLVAEVAITTVAIDNAKAKVYAAAGIPEFWLVLPEEQRVIVFRSPGNDGYLVSESVDAASSLLTALCRMPLRLTDVFTQ